MESLTTVPLLIIDDFGMRKLPLTAAEDLLEIIMRRYERASTLLTSNRPVEDWGKLLADVAAVTAMLDRILHHGHVLKCGPRSWRTKTAPPLREAPSESDCWTRLARAPPCTLRGLRPCDPAENQGQNLSEKENPEAAYALPLVGIEQDASGQAKTKLARTGTGAVKQLHVLAAASLAGFEVITDGRFAVITEVRLAQFISDQLH